jgi:hypothetical protein
MLLTKEPIHYNHFCTTGFAADALWKLLMLELKYYSN